MKSLRQFDLNLLVLFEALITERHVSRAAEKVFLSQSAMSHALNRLRDLLDDPLLVRTENGLQPTPRAEQMLPQVREALQLVGKTLQPPTPFDPKSSDRVFRLACSDYFETVVFPEWFSSIHKLAPGIRVEVALISDEMMTQHLEQGEIDLIVGLEAGQKLPAHLIVEQWCTEHQLCLAAQTHNSINNRLDLDAYLEQQHILFFDLEGETQSGTDQWLKSLGFQRNEIARVTNYMAGARLAAQSKAVITLPSRMALLFSEMLPLRVIEPPEQMPQIDMTIIQHPLYEDDPAIRWLKEEIKQYGQQQDNH
ncbi:LysR family transcriptional regulator [Neptuniibacter caesariensis]|uniref:Probable transcriptional regulator n=1 Tax=Neptuniibacter caesariensis TaxID=207954 RepID=A0A7U8C2I6_NEPCE|nr:LysR family transcriptional regulator [Neptuniibacter caesariensis]EAR60302.1 probable transcriptional regulator [Oceanospirillum sp. MED92] [Neptuniibacter caesariensis]